MKRWMFLGALLLISGGARLLADDEIRVETTSDDISEGLDLKAVATLFGEVKDLDEFERRLNSDSLHLSNLDLNGDGQVDYLRVVEKEKEDKKHLVLIQAVLAKDIYQDIASIYVESKADLSVFVQVIGDEHIYGKNYVIEPVYIYRPVIYDWFWGPGWTCYTSPWYWGYWPGWYAPYPCWGYHDYWAHVHVYHYDHPRCSYRYASTPHQQATRMWDPVRRTDYASAHSSQSFTARTGMSNAREYGRSASSTATRSASSATTRSASSAPTRSSSASSSRTVSRTAGSTYTGGGRTSSATTSYSGGSRTSSATTSYSSGGGRTSSASSSYSSGGGRTSSATTSYSSGGGRTSSASSSYSSGGGRTSSASSSGGRR